MKCKRFLALVMSILLITALFAGCSASKAAGSAYYSDSRAPMEEMGSSNGLADSAGSTEAAAIPQNQKLIRTLYLDAETEDMDPLLQTINQQITDLGGYIEAQEISNDSLVRTKYRFANLTIRIPAENLDRFVSHVSDHANITSNRETTEDITLRYVAVESRITALQTEQTRLLELLAKAETMNDLLLIESRLTDVRAELEQVTSQLRVMDNQVNYGTIHLTLTQVEQYTQPEPETFWQKVGTGFVKSLKGLGNLLLGLVYLLIVALPYLVIPAAILAVLLIINKRRKKKKEPKEKNPQ